MVYRKNPLSRDQLRRLAAQRLAGNADDARAADSLPEMLRLIEELEIHQIELEMQNEHLNAARAQLEAALNQSSEQYDFLPLGCLLLDSSGVIVRMNLALASLLGAARSTLMGSRFGLHVAQAQRALFNALLERARVTGEVQDGELALVKKGMRAATPVHVRVAALPDAMGWQVVVVDITERKLGEDRLRASEERLALALESVGDGVWDWNVATGALVLSRRFEQLYGFAENEYGQHMEDWLARIHPDDKPNVLEALHNYLDGQSEGYSMELRGQCKDGSWRWVLSRGAIVSRGADGRASRMIGTHVDVTLKKQTEESLRQASQFQQAVFEALSAHLLVLDRQRNVIQANAAWRQYALEKGCLRGQAHGGVSYLDIVADMTGGDREMVRAVADGIAAVAGGELPHFQLEQPFFALPDRRWYSLKVTPMCDAEQRVLVSHEDVSSLKAAELASRTLANIDALTGALSRRNFMNLAEQEVARSMRYELPLMLLMLDLDHFKQINDQHGHAAGDAVLQGFVKTVAAVLRESDLLGRLGGEEFAVLLPNTTREGGCALAQRIIDCVHANPTDFHAQGIAFTVSIGAACLSNQNSIAALLGLADAALYRAKNGGRDRLELGMV